MNIEHRSSMITNLSRSISISILHDNSNEASIQTADEQRFELFIPRDPNLNSPPMIFQNVTSIESNSHRQILNLHFANITHDLDISVHIELSPVKSTFGYLFIYKFDQIPQLNISMKQIDGWSLFCPSGMMNAIRSNYENFCAIFSDLTNENLYKYFLNNDQVSTHQSIVIGLRELNATESKIFCSNQSLNHPPITDQPFQFTSNYALRIYTSGCYYLDEKNSWQSDGLTVSFH